MKSKARELLQRVIKNQYINDSDNKNLRDEITELLAQPEQEPVAWRGVNCTGSEGIWLYRDCDEPFTDQNFKNVGEALYLTPQKPEPLSDEEISAAIAGHDPTPGGAWMFNLGVRWYEKHRGIGRDIGVDGESMV